MVKINNNKTGSENTSKIGTLKRVPEKRMVFHHLKTTQK